MTYDELYDYISEYIKNKQDYPDEIKKIFDSYESDAVGIDKTDDYKIIELFNKNSNLSIRLIKKDDKIFVQEPLMKPLYFCNINDNIIEKLV